MESILPGCVKWTAIIGTDHSDELSSALIVIILAPKSETFINHSNILYCRESYFIIIYKQKWSKFEFWALTEQWYTNLNCFLGTIKLI